MAALVPRQVIELCRPLDSRLEHVDFESLFSSLSVRHLLCVFASLLLERRVIFIADKLRYQPTLATSDCLNDLRLSGVRRADDILQRSSSEVTGGVSGHLGCRLRTQKWCKTR